MTVNRTSQIKSTIKIQSGSSFVKIRPYFSYDCKNILLAAGNDIKVFSVASGECLRHLIGHPTALIGLQTNPKNHTQLISCSRDGTIITWDYVDGIFLKSFKIRGDEDVLAFFAPSKSTRVFVIQFSKDQNDFHLRSLNLKENIQSTRFVMRNVLPSEHTVAFGAQGEFVVSVNEKNLQVFDLKKGIMKSHMSQSKLVCVACHPSEYVAATGDETGRVVLWSNIFDKPNLCHSIYHWHTLPVSDLCFSSEGSYLYSGGGECVLVKWSLKRENKEFLPRLGMPLCHLACAPANAFIAVSHLDNAVSLVSPQLQVVQYIQGLSQGQPWSCPGQQIVPTGLLHDPRTGALVLSGRPGHLQFFSLKHDKQLYSVDIVGQNFLTQERNQKIYNTQVEKAAIDSSGLWMATIQRFDNGHCSPEIVLKIWKFDGLLQTYSLNTSVILPHYQKVTSLRFRPEMENEPPLFVTASEDLSFKTWVLQSEEQGATSIESWNCEFRGYYRDQCPVDISFKHEGSTLAVAFQKAVTLWNPSPLIMRTVFSHSTTDSLLRQVFFGRETCSDLLVGRSDDCLTVWDTVLQKPTWKAQLKTTYLAADPLTEYMVAFSQDYTLFVFKPSSSEPCFIKENVSSSDIIAAAFMPYIGGLDTEKKSLLFWQQKSHLYFLNKEQELLTVINETDGSETLNVNEEQDSTKEVSNALRVNSGTSFAVLMAQHKSSGVKTEEILDHYSTRGLLGARQVKELLEIPSHVMPPLRSLCCQFMSALLIPKSSQDS